MCCVVLVVCCVLTCDDVVVDCFCSLMRVACVMCAVCC